MRDTRACAYTNAGRKRDKDRVITVRTDRDVARYTLLMTAYAIAVPIISVAVILAGISRYTPVAQEFSLLFLGLAAMIPMCITPPVAWCLLQVLKKLYLSTERIDRHVRFDLLTGALNRSHFLDQLRGSRENGVLLIADLDHFKRVNDDHGHDAGDQALILFTNLLHREIGQHGLIARLGGEEFAIFMPGHNLVQGKLIAQRLCLAACHARAIADDDYLHPTVTLGGTIRNADEPIGITLKRADVALYAAKAAGRNRARFDDELVTPHPEKALNSLLA